MKIIQSLRSALVVDDEPLLVNLARRALSAFGFRDVESADSGATALERMGERQRGYDVVLCDLAMPDMDGVEFLHHLGEHRYAGAIIIVSGQDDRVIQSVADIANQYRLNVIGCLKKPFAIKALRELIDKLERVPESPAPADTTRREDLDFSPTELANAIFSKELGVQFQPKMSLATGDIRSVEALARWQLAGKGLISPARFVPVAEQHELARPLTELILDKSLAQCRHWLDHGISLPVAVNIPAFTLADSSLPLHIKNAAGQAGVSPEMLTIEITESQLMREPLKSLETLNRLRLQGIRLSIDDFGTGYSSLKQLQLIPFQELKIDKGFVQRALDDSVSMAIVESSVQLARNAGLKIVAEGVETAEQLALMRRLACDEVQGYYIARPMDGEAVDGWLAANRLRWRHGKGSDESPGSPSHAVGVGASVGASA